MKPSKSLPSHNASATTSKSLISTLFTKIEKAIIQETVHNYMPKANEHKNNQLMEAIVKVQNLKPQQSTGTANILENPKMKPDNFSTGKARVLQSLRPKSMSHSATPRNRLRNRSVFGKSFSKHQSIQSDSKLKPTAELQQRKYIELPTKNSVNEISFSIDLLRLRMLNIEEQTIIQKKKKEDHEQQRQQQRKKMQRKVRQYTNFTQDYEGIFFGVNPEEKKNKIQQIMSNVPQQKKKSKKEIQKYIKLKKPLVSTLRNRRVEARNEKIKTLQNQFQERNCQGSNEVTEYSNHIKLQKNVKLFSEDLPAGELTTTHDSTKQSMHKYQSLEEFKQTSLKFHKFYHKVQRDLKQQKNLAVSSESNIVPLGSVEHLEKSKLKATLSTKNKLKSSINSPVSSGYLTYNNRLINGYLRRRGETPQTEQPIEKQKNDLIHIKNKHLFEKTIDMNKTYF